MGDRLRPSSLLQLLNTRKLQRQSLRPTPNQDTNLNLDHNHLHLLWTYLLALGLPAVASRQIQTVKPVAELSRGRQLMKLRTMEGVSKLAVQHNHLLLRVCQSG